MSEWVVKDLSTGREVGFRPNSCVIRLLSRGDGARFCYPDDAQSFRMLAKSLLKFRGMRLAVGYYEAGGTWKGDDEDV